MTTLPVAPRADELDLENLLAQVGLGSIAAFADLYDRWAPALHGISIAVFEDAGAAAEATEAAFIDVWRRAPRYRVAQDPERWLLTTAVRSIGRRLGAIPDSSGSPDAPRTDVPGAA